ncbi:MAG: uncharacterized protein H6Q90_6447 [Deltaproteobacteria bacterium]|nr:uncharacterized protein [Deltaproteobacteria bacterium]
MRSGNTLGSGPLPGQDLPVGTMVGEYQIQGLLGEGGMGRVWKAVHPVIAKQAAVKVLHPELSVNRQAVERFVQEARAVNQIGHPNIVDIFAFGTLPDGRCYFVMEQLRGESLRERIARQLPSIGEALGILDTIAMALEAAHETSIIHRDLKPDNVFLVETRGERPTVKLLDFGIAKLLGNDEGRAERTQTGNVLGTPAYISPEQARGIGVDHRTDIYALGALAFELLTARLPFPATNAADMIAQHLYQPPPSPRAVNPYIPVELDALVMCMLAKDANHRPTLAIVREQLRACRALVTGQGIEASFSQLRASAVGQGMVATIAVDSAPVPAIHTAVPPRRSSMRLAAVLGGLVIAGGVAAAVVGFSSASGTSKVAPAPAPAATPTPTPAVTPPPTAPEPAQVATPPVSPADVVAPAEPVTVEAKPEVVKPKKPRPRPSVKPNKPRPDDDDAPM